MSLTQTNGHLVGQGGAGNSDLQRRTLLIALAVVAMTFSLTTPTARAQSQLPETPESPQIEPYLVDPTALESARLLLSGYHGVPDRASFEAQIPQARQLLLAIATEPDLLPLHRSRAVAALAQWDDDEVLDTLSALLVGDATDDLLRHHVIMALGTSFGERALTPLRHCLSDPDVQIRLTAIEALSKVGTISARNILEQARELETSPVVRQRLDIATAHVLSH